MSDLQVFHLYRGNDLATVLTSVLYISLLCLLNNSFRGQRYKFYVDKRQSHSFFRFYFQLDVLRGLQVSYTQLSIAKMLKKSCRLYLNGHCFFFMKQYAYLCTKMIMYGTKYLQTCLDRRGTELY